jgi:hypothetical protein
MLGMRAIPRTLLPGGDVVDRPERAGTKGDSGSTRPDRERWREGAGTTRSLDSSLYADLPYLTWRIRRARQAFLADDRTRRSITSRSLTRPDFPRPSQPSPISRNTYRHGPRNRRPGRFRARPGPDRAMSLSEGTEGRRRSPDRGRCCGDSSRQPAVLGRRRAFHAAPAVGLLERFPPACRVRCEAVNFSTFVRWFSVLMDISHHCAHWVYNP